MFRVVSFMFVGSAVVATTTSSVMAQYATQVVSYTPGAGTSSAYRDPSRALGEPSRFNPGNSPGAVTPFQSAFQSTQLVQVGRGGSLVVAFGQPITDDPSNPFGLDFIVFGNSFFVQTAGAPGTTNGAISAEGGDIDVSADGVTWFRVATNAADGLFPTLGYSDLTNPYSSTPGQVLSNFQQPVDPSFVVGPGTTFAQIVAGYNGSGGGLGVDIASSGLTSVNYVRISVDAAAASVPEIDGFAIVPAPGAAATLVVLGIAAARRRR